MGRTGKVELIMECFIAWLRIIVKVSSFSFQIAGAVLLLLWSLRKRDRRIKEMCLSGSNILWGELSENGCFTPIAKEDLQTNAKTVYQNNCAFFYIVIGYLFAIFDGEVCISVWFIASLVCVCTTLLLLLGQLIPSIAAKRTYPVDQEIPTEEFAASNKIIFEDITNKEE